MMPRVLSTPLAAVPTTLPSGTPRRIAPDLLAAVLPGPGRDRLASNAVLAVTTGQQPGLFTGPLYTIHKALSAIALAARVERERGDGVPVVPVFWLAGDDHDFAEANHVWVLDRAGEPAKIVLRERPHDAPSLPLFREPCGPEIAAALKSLDDALPDSEFKPDVLKWLGSAYTPGANLADACAEALQRLLGDRGGGLAVLRAHDRHAKRAAVPWILKGLDEILADGLTPVLVEGKQGRDRLKKEGNDFVTRRSGERFTRADLERIGTEEPERLSPNVLLRPAVEAALFPTIAYVGGPAEMEYLQDATPLFKRLGVEQPARVARWSGLIIESRVDKVLERHALTPADFADGCPGEPLEARLVREGLPPDVVGLFNELRANVEARYGQLGDAVQRLDPTLERTVQSARNAALAGTHEIEKKLVASLKRAQGTLVGQLARTRAALAPGGKPQERVLTAATFLARYGTALLDEIAAEVARWAAAP